MVQLLSELEQHFLSEEGNVAIKDAFKNIFSYFEIDGPVDGEEQGEAYRMENDAPKMRVASVQTPTDKAEPGGNETVPKPLPTKSLSGPICNA